MTTARLRSSDVKFCNNSQLLMRDFTANRRVILNQSVFSPFGNFQQYVLDEPLTDEEAGEFIATAEKVNAQVALNHDRSNVFDVSECRPLPKKEIEHFSIDKAQALNTAALFNKVKMVVH